MSGTSVDTSRDEEIARALQMSIDSTSHESVNDGTMVALPPVDSQPKSASTTSTAAGGHNAPHSNEAAQPTGLLLAKLKALVQTFIVGYSIWWIFSVLARAWWFLLDFAFVFVPVGWIGIKKNLAHYVRYFYFFVAADLLFQVMFIFVYEYEISGVGAFMCLVFVILQGIGAYYVRRYSILIATQTPLPVTTSSSVVA